MDLQQAMLGVHVVGIIYWMGGLFGTSWILVARNPERDVFFKKTMGGLARRLGLSADVGATLAMGSGLYLLIVYKFYEQPYMHIKLAAVVVLLGLHGFIRAKSKRASESDGVNFPGWSPLLLGLLTAGIVFIIILKPLAK